MNPIQSEPPHHTTVRLSNDLETIAFARMVIRHSLPPLEEELESLFFGAFTEIVTNAIQEHTRRAIDTDVEVVISNGRHPLIEVVDSGAGFDADAPTSADDRLGLGLLITRSVVPGMSIESGPSGTRVSLPYPAAES